MIRARKMSKAEIIKINSFIPMALRHADRYYPGDKVSERGRWNKVYLQEMDQLAIEAGLRVDLVRERNEKKRAKV